ncbi:T9SS type A sorting domain-containing protein [candidate division KSB1 bacterium]|nr:T9SS type A sorting domain-containing protein [candidate division KSB1 bacterium]
MKKNNSFTCLFVCFILMVLSNTGNADQIQLNPGKDNTIYSDQVTNSNGAGPYLHVARSCGEIYLRRALIAFEIAGNIPSGSTINSAAFTMRLNKSSLSGNSSSVKLYRLLSDWGEGGSNAGTSGGQGAPAQTGDATWTYTFYSTSFWSAAGGDFNGFYSATKTVGSSAIFYTWGTTAQMVSDVQGWLDNPDSNFGWIIIGDESIDYTGKRFCSRDNSTASYRPVLTVDYTPPVEVTFVNGADASLNFYPGAPTPPQNDWPFGQFSLSAAVEGVVFNSVDITIGGSFNGLSGSTPFQLFAANSNDYGSASSIGADAAGSGGTVSFTGLNDALPAGTRYYWLTADLGVEAAGNIYASIDNANTVSLTSGALGGSSCYGLLNAGGDPSLPVCLITFTATQTGSGVVLNWATESETDNLGFVLERKTINADMWSTIASYRDTRSLIGQGNSTFRTEYKYLDKTVIPRTNYIYRLSDVNLPGQISVCGYAKIFVSGDILPDETRLFPAYPNPFNAQTRITYQLADDENVTITIYDVTGRLVQNLSPELPQQKGAHSIIWDGTDVNGRTAPTGIYLIHLQAGSATKTGKVLLLR